MRKSIVRPDRFLLAVFLMSSGSHSVFSHPLSSSSSAERSDGGDLTTMMVRSGNNHAKVETLPTTTGHIDHDDGRSANHPTVGAAAAVVQEDDAQFWERFLSGLEEETEEEVMGGGGGGRNLKRQWKKHPWKNKKKEMSITGKPTPPPNPPPTTQSPSEPPSNVPTPEPPSNVPTTVPTEVPTTVPSPKPSEPPSNVPTNIPTQIPSPPPSTTPTSVPTLVPTELPTTVPTAPPSGVCRLDADVDCVINGEVGAPCEDLAPPATARCSGRDQAPISTFTFSYIGITDSTCDDSRNQQGVEAQCRDVEIPLVETIVDIDCLDLLQQPFTVEPARVAPGATFTVTNPGQAQKMNCTISSSAGNLLQYNVIDISGNVELDLREQYGALRVEACNDLTCIADVSITTTLDNSGENALTLTAVEENLNGFTVDIQNRFRYTSNGQPLEPLYLLETEPPSQQAFYEREIVPVDLCDTSTFAYRVDVFAEPEEGGVSCDADDFFNISIEPQCILDMTLTCTHLESDQDCDSIPEIQSADCQCGDSCPTELVFRYTPTTCNEASSDSSSVLNCVQYSATMPENPQVTITNGGSSSGSQKVYFSGQVTPNQNIVVADSNGGCIPTEEPLSVLITTSFTTSAGGTPVQEFQLVPNCGTDRSMALTDSFVSMDFLGFTCQNSGRHNNCFANVAFEACAINNGVVDLTLTSFAFQLEEEDAVDDRDLLNDPAVNANLRPHETTCANPVEYEINLCRSNTPTTWKAKGDVEGTDTSRKQCTGEAENEFDVEPIPTFPPSSVPSEIPSPFPSDIPTEVPSLSPTENCDLIINASCVGCNKNRTDLEECLQRPFRMNLLFRGGTCEENDNLQADRVECGDFPENGGVPPTDAFANTSVYIRANRDPKDELGGLEGDDEDVLFEGVVNMGGVFSMYAGGENLPADTQIRIYPATGPRTPETILQDVRYHASCSQPLLISNIFGSVQVWSFENELQGNVTIFTSQSSTFTINIPVDSLPSGDSILTIVGANIRVNYEVVGVLEDEDGGEIPLPDLIGDRLCSPEVAAIPENNCVSTIDIEFESVLDFSSKEPRYYEQRITIFTQGDVSGQRCVGDTTFGFEAPLDYGLV